MRSHYTNGLYLVNAVLRYAPPDGGLVCDPFGLRVDENPSGAGDEGIEPSAFGLESKMLPLHQSPRWQAF